MICRIRQNARSEPKFHHMEMLDGVGRSMREWLIIFIIGLDLRIGVIPSPKNQEHWHYTSILDYSNSLYRLRTSMRPNIILRSNSDHKPIISNPIHRDRPRPMNLRWVLHWQPHPFTILHPTLYSTFHYHRSYNSPSAIPTRNRIKQPLRNLIRLRQNPLPPLLHN